MMKKLFYVPMFSVLTVMFAVHAVHAGDDFFDFIDYAVSGSGPDKNIDACMYGARVTTAWNDANENGDLDEGEYLTRTVRIFNRHGELAVESPDGLSKSGLEDWAVAHAAEILNAIFPAGFSEGTGESEDSFMAERNFRDSVFQKVKPAAAEQISSEFKGALEYLFADVNNDDGNAASMVLGYDYEADSGFQFHMMLPYRYTFMDDEINSDSHYAGLNFSGKYPVKEWDSMAWNVGADIFGSVFYLTSDAAEHSGNLRYGGGLFTSFVRELNVGLVSFGVDYKISKSHMPSGMMEIDDDADLENDSNFIDEVIDYINDLDPVQSLSYGLNFGMPVLGEKGAVNIELVRTNFFSDDVEDDRDARTLAAASFSYYPVDTFELNLGVTRTFELEDIELTSVALGVLFRY